MSVKQNVIEFDSHTAAVQTFLDGKAQVMATPPVNCSTRRPGSVSTAPAAWMPQLFTTPSTTVRKPR
jgi:hypothetical protein